MNKKITMLLICGILFLTAACGSLAEKTNVRLAVIKGPTGMGAVRLMEENDAGGTENNYAVTVSGAPDAVVAGLLTAEYDIAALPTNTIAMLYAKTDGEIQCLAVNTLSTLYLLEKGSAIASAADVVGKSVVCAGQGTTVQATVERLFEGADIHYASEHTEAVAQAAIGKYDYVILPEPFVTTLIKQDAGFRVALDIGALWKENGLGELPMGGIAVRKTFADENPEAIQAFLMEYKKSVDAVNADPEAAALLMERYEILAAANAVEAIPRANMTCVSGDELRELLLPYYQVLADVNPALIGGDIPGDDFFRAP